MISATLRLSRVAVAIAALFAAAAPAAAGDYFIKLEGMDVPGRATQSDGQHIDLLSYSFGSGQAGAVGANENISVDGARTERRLKPGTVTTVKVTKPQSTGRVTGLAVDPSDPSASGQADGDPDRPVIVGQVPNASGRRQHRPVTITKEWDASTPQLSRPLAKGSVWVKVATPWAACRVGTRYPSLQLGGGGKSYVLRDVTVASCGRSRAGDDRPTEEVAFYYNRIAFNYAASPGN